MKTIKTVILNGTSLTVSITKELKAMGLGRGDRVIVTLERENEKR